MTKKVTNSSQSGAIEKATVAPEVIPVSEHIDFNDVPFVHKKTREGARPYQYDPKHEPIVEIAGKVHELKDIDKADVLDIIDKSRYLRKDDDLTQSAKGPNCSVSRWSRRGPITLADVSFKHVNVDGVDIYISTGSELVITGELHLNYYSEQFIERQGSKVVILLSQINTKYLSVLGKNVFINSTLTMGESTTLIDAGLTNTLATSSAGSITIDDSSLLDTSLHVTGHTTITDSDINSLNITGLSTVTLDRVIGGRGFNLSLYSQKGKEVSLHVNNQCIHGFNYHTGIHNSDGYVSLDDFPRFDNGLILKIEKRTDYGYFATVKPLPFIRLNQFDLLVDGEIFSVKEFFPELIDENAQKPTPVLAPQHGPFGDYSRFGGYAPQPFPLTPGYWSRSSEVWKRAARIAFDANGKKVIGRTGELIVNSLLDQIKSRINLYVELNSLG